jgi:hypothetical protein
LDRFGLFKIDRGATAKSGEERRLIGLADDEICVIGTSASGN